MANTIGVNNYDLNRDLCFIKFQIADSMINLHINPFPAIYNVKPNMLSSNLHKFEFALFYSYFTISSEDWEADISSYCLCRIPFGFIISSWPNYRRIINTGALQLAL